MVLCMSETHPWSKRRHVRIEALHETSMVVYESGYFIRQMLDQRCAEHGVSPQYRMQSNFLPLLVRMVRLGLGTAVGLKLMARAEPGIVGVPLLPRTDLGLSLARRRGRAISRANQAFWDWVARRPG
jgi:DNA-binding transcriptional LysR family regulator